MLIRSHENVRAKLLSKRELPDRSYLVVCAVFAFKEQTPMYVLDDSGVTIEPADGVEVHDARMSRYWRYACHFRTNPHPLGYVMLLGFPEFLDDSFRVRLFDREPQAEAVFDKYREMMLLEFALPGIERRAKNLEDGWIMCAKCCDAWQQSLTLDEMVRCGTCGEIQLRPVIG